MKKTPQKVRSHKLIFRVSEEELQRITKLQQKTTEKTISNYLRKVSLQEPVVVLHRNGSADDFLKEMVPLKRELSTIGNNFNQAVKKLHVLDKIPEFRSWLLIYDRERIALLEKIANIQSLTIQLHEQWLQKSVRPQE